ncbi:MAG: S-adenosylmethionine decarboxylase [Candidatus Margulisbacteria bacterium]|nr:S-adenosylmethionine decarboxylase [Candidatus Margulisiibacteriota bacterium]
MRSKEKIKYRSGSHLMLDCFGCLKEKLQDGAYIHQALETLTKKMQMNKIRDPYVFRYDGKSEDEHGISGILLIEESHITIHSFPKKQHVFVDIFSCRDFDTNLAINFLVNSFEAKDHKVEITCHGAELPHQIKIAGNLAQDERNKVLTHL